jgi:hypothetical protein
MVTVVMRPLKVALTVEQEVCDVLVGYANGSAIAC